jgi:hypothetical protein
MTSDYAPAPLSTEDVVLGAEILDVVEKLAANAHEVWARQRMLDGWVYGPQRSDEARQHPCLVPYLELPESEKAYDRNAVVGTIRALLALGYVIRKA